MVTIPVAQNLTQVSPRFLQQIANAVHYWLGEAQHLEDGNIAALDRERTNIIRVLDYSLKVDSLVYDSAELIRQLFKLIEQRTYWSEWIPVVEQALAVLPLPETLLWAQLSNQLGFLQRLCRNYDASLTAHRNALALCEQENHLEERNITYLFLANTYFDQHQFEQSHSFGTLALSGFDAQHPAPDSSKFAAAHNLLGLIASQRGSYVESLSLFNRAIAHWKQTSQFVYLARAWCNLADAQTWLGAFEDALASYAAAEQVLTKTISDEDLIRIMNGRGSVYYEMKAWLKAEMAYADAFKLAQKSAEFRYWQAVTASNLGETLMKQEHWMVAEPFLQASLQALDTTGDSFLIANTRGLLATNYANQGQIEKSLSLFSAAIAILDDYPDHEPSRRRQQELVNEMQQLTEKAGSS